jgi:hypothetical protein
MASKSQADSQNNTLLNVQLSAPETAVCLPVVLHAMLHALFTLTPFQTVNNKSLQQNNVQPGNNVYKSWNF